MLESCQHRLCPRGIYGLISSGPLLLRLNRGRSAWNTVWAQAAAVILLVGGSSGLTYLTMSDGDDATVPGIAETPVLVFEQASANFGSQYTLGPDYQEARHGHCDPI